MSSFWHVSSYTAVYQYSKIRFCKCTVYLDSIPGIILQKMSQYAAMIPSLWEQKAISCVGGVFARQGTDTANARA